MTDTVQVCNTLEWPIPVTIVGGGGGSSGGLTDTQLRASPVGVAVSNWPAGWNVTVGNWPASWAINNFPASFNVGNFPASQTINGNVGVTGNVAVTGTFWQATQPVSGTFWQATQPVSIAATVNVAGPLTDTQLRASAVSITGALTDTQLRASPVSITGALTDTQLRASAVVVSGPLTDTQLRASAVPISIAATVATRDLKDNSRTLFSAATVIGGVTCVTTEAMLSMVPTRAGVATAGATSIKATAGKTLRLTTIVFSHRSTSAAVLSGRCALRMNPAGAAVAASPILAILSTTQQAAALAEGGDTCVLPLPDGIEISGNQEVGLSQVCSAITGVVYATLIGYEY